MRRENERDWDSRSGYERELAAREHEWFTSQLHAGAGMPFDPRSVYPGYPFRDDGEEQS